MPRLRAVLQEPHATLRTPVRSIDHDEISSLELVRLVEQMIVTMQHERGVGLAAPQIGESLAVIVVQPDEKKTPAVYFNPEITWYSRDMHILDEGCLSVKGKWGAVKRSKRVHFKAVGRRGEKVRLKAAGLLAQILQHEVDHLHGALFVDKAEHVYVVPKNHESKH